MKYWFLCPDLTFHKDGVLQLGTVLAHPFEPSKILASPGNRLPEDLDLPPRTKLIESGHKHSRAADASSASMQLRLAFLNMVSLEGQGSERRATTSEYGTTDHEVWVLDRTLSDRCVEAILEVPAVRKHRKSGYLRDRPIYVVTGVRITRSSFPVIVRDDSRVSIRSSASASDPTGTVPITAGFEADVRSARTVLDAYNTAPDIVFAYRVHVLRDIGDGEVDQEMFAHKAAFLTGTTSDSDLEYLEVNPQILAQDISQRVENVQVHSLGDDEAWISGGVVSSVTDPL